MPEAHDWLADLKFGDKFVTRFGNRYTLYVVKKATAKTIVTCELVGPLVSWGTYWRIRVSALERLYEFLPWSEELQELVNETNLRVIEMERRIFNARAACADVRKRKQEESNRLLLERKYNSGMHLYL